MKNNESFSSDSDDSILSTSSELTEEEDDTASTTIGPNFELSSLMDQLPIKWVSLSSYLDIYIYIYRYIHVNQRTNICFVIYNFVGEGCQSIIKGNPNPLHHCPMWDIWRTCLKRRHLIRKRRWSQARVMEEGWILAKSH